MIQIYMINLYNYKFLWQPLPADFLKCIKTFNFKENVIWDFQASLNPHLFENTRLGIFQWMLLESTWSNLPTLFIWHKYDYKWLKYEQNNQKENYQCNVSINGLQFEG